MYQRSVSQFEQQQRRIELEHHELLQRVSRLTDEVSSTNNHSARSRSRKVRWYWKNAWGLLSYACY